MTIKGALLTELNPGIGIYSCNLGRIKIMSNFFSALSLQNCTPRFLMTGRSWVAADAFSLAAREPNTSGYLHLFAWLWYLLSRGTSLHTCSCNFSLQRPGTWNAGSSTYFSHYFTGMKTSTAETVPLFLKEVVFFMGLFLFLNHKTRFLHIFSENKKNSFTYREIHSSAHLILRQLLTLSNLQSYSVGKTKCQYLTDLLFLVSY